MDRANNMHAEHNRDAKEGPESLGAEDNDPGLRAEWFWRSRLDAEGRPLRGVYLQAARHIARLKHKDPVGGPIVYARPVAPPGVNWTPLGPSIINEGITACGRVTSIVAGPGGTRVYAGAADGGVWISTNAGASWTPLDDYYTAPTFAGSSGWDANSLSTGAIEIRFGTTPIDDEIFIGTGEANSGWPNPAFPPGNWPEFSPTSYFGVGIRHRIGGAWSLEATNLASEGIYRIVVDPNDITPTNIYAATTIGLFKRPTGGASPVTWNPIPISAAAAGRPVSDFIAAGSGTSRVFYAAVAGDTVYSSQDGTTWAPLSGLGTLPTTVNGRIALAASESNPNIIFALTAPGDLFRLDRSLGTAFQAVAGLPAGTVGTQLGYCMALAVDPGDPNTVYLGGVSLYKGTLTASGSGATFPAGGPTYVGMGTHADMHALVFALNASGSSHDRTNVWIGNDGGVYQSGSSGAPGTFQGRNLGLAITQCFSVGHRTDTDAVLISGTQDNAGLRLIGEQAAQLTAGVGDGGNCVFHPIDPYRAIMQYKGTGLVATTDGGGSWNPISTFPPPPPYSTGNTETSRTSFVAPITAIAAPAAAAGALFAFGTDRLWLSEDWGSTWETLPSATNPYVMSPPDLTQDVIDPASSSTNLSAVTAIAFALPTRIYASTARVLLRYDKTGANWTSSSLPVAGIPAGYYITGIASENAAAGTLYMTLGGAGLPHVYYWDGTAWHAAMPASVVDVPAHAVTVDPVTNNLYVGTDVGCWQGVRTGLSWTWSLFSDGLPEAAILQLAIHDRAHLLRAATMGRGLWEIPLDAGIIGRDPDIYLRVNYADTGRIVAGARHPWVEGAPDPTNPGVALYHWMSADIKVRRSSLMGLPSLSSPATYYDFAFNIGDYVQPSTSVETADVGGMDTIFVEVHNRSVNPVAAANVRVLLLVADASAALPPLPVNWNTHVNNGDTGSWLGGSQWQFVDPIQPYHPLPSDLDVRMPQVAAYQFDFSTLGLPAGHEHVCLAAFVTTVDGSDPITATDTDLNTVTMSDKHVAHRNLHLVALGARPLSLTRPPKYMAINFHNPHTEAGIFDLAFDRKNFPGEISLLLPALSSLSPNGPVLSGFRLEKRGTIERLREEIGEYIGRLGEYLEQIGRGIIGEENTRKMLFSAHRATSSADLDRSHILVAPAGTSAAKLSGVHIPSGGSVTAVFALKQPLGSAKGDCYRLDVLQYHGKRVTGGSSYVVVVV